MQKIELKIEKVRNKISEKISDNDLFNVMFEMNRTFDKEFVECLHDVDINLNQKQRDDLRLFYYYGLYEFLKSSNLDTFSRYNASINDKNDVLDSFLDKCEKYDENKIIKSFNERYKRVSEGKIKDNSKKWLSYYKKKRDNMFDYSLFIYDYDQKYFIEDDFNINNIFQTIAGMYDRLENYRYFIFKLSGKLFDENEEDVTWKVLYKIGIYCENFISFSDEFRPYNKKDKINQLVEFLNDRFPENNNTLLAENFYKSISTGFKFEDCLVSESQNNIILIYQKIKLDVSSIPCPACMSTIQNGNSYPEMFLRSYECKNPSCPKRSKSGRGKRFDEYGTYRYFKLVENKNCNNIDDSLYNKWRKDIFSDKNDIYEMLLKYYAWDNEKVCMTQNKKIKYHNRKIIIYTENNSNKYIKKFEELPIYKLFNSINKIIPIIAQNKQLNKQITVINGDSTEELNKFSENQIGAAITSPPYYNAREYSQWSNLLLYLIDMLRNCKSVYRALKNNGFYLYNIGDIVNSDNIYVSSNMSKRRLQLGFLSAMIFEISGFNLVGNIIWNKGEVQSKRNSTMNHNSGYIKCINCYEHVLVFKKGKEKNIVSDVKEISPVIKINSKGENLVKHSAPYPIELVEIIKPFVDNTKYVLDPFLGTGTTLRWCINNNIKGIGFELNDKYYQLAKKNINDCEEEK